MGATPRTSYNRVHNVRAVAMATLCTQRNSHNRNRFRILFHFFIIFFFYRLCLLCVCGAILIFRIIFVVVVCFFAYFPV